MQMFWRFTLYAFEKLNDPDIESLRNQVQTGNRWSQEPEEFATTTAHGKFQWAKFPALSSSSLGCPFSNGLAGRQPPLRTGEAVIIHP